MKQFHHDPSDSEADDFSPNNDELIADLGDFASNYKFPLEDPNTIVPRRTFVPDQVTVGYLATPIKRSSSHSLYAAQCSTTSSSLLTSHFDGAIPRQPVPSDLPRGLTMRTLVDVLIIHPKDEFDSYTYNSFPALEVAQDRRAGQCNTSMPKVNTKIILQKIPDPDGLGLTRSQLEEHLATQESWIAQIYNCAQAAGELMLADDHRGSMNYVFDIVTKSLKALTRTHLRRISILFNRPQLSSLIQEENQFISANLMGILSSAIKNQNEVQSFQSGSPSSSAAASTQLALPTPTAIPPTTSPTPSVPHPASLSSTIAPVPAPIPAPTTALSADDFLQSLQSTLQARRGRNTRFRGSRYGQRGRGGGGAGGGGGGRGGRGKNRGGYQGRGNQDWQQPKNQNASNQPALPPADGVG
jgi:hypothetical protein